MCKRGEANQKWLVEKHGSAYIASCYSGNQQQFLSHGCGWLWLQNWCFGAGELWELDV